MPHLISTKVVYNKEFHIEPNIGGQINTDPPSQSQVPIPPDTDVKINLRLIKKPNDLSAELRPL